MLSWKTHRLHALEIRQKHAYWEIPSRDKGFTRLRFLFFIPGWNYILVFLRGCLHVKFLPGMNLSLSKRQRWNFILEWKKEKKTCKHFIPGWNYTMSMIEFSGWNSCVNRIFFIPRQVSSWDEVSSWLHVNTLWQEWVHPRMKFHLSKNV